MVAAVTPPRRPVSVRRTTTHDCTRSEGLEGPVTVAARGRDLRTNPDGRSVVLATGQLDLEARFSDGAITRIETGPVHAALDQLVGVTAYAGFRRAVDEAMPGERRSRSIRFQLLDDLPMALLLSGRVLRAVGIGLRRHDPGGPLPVDICAGWAAGGALLAGFTEFGPPLHNGPVAPQVESKDNPLGWHSHEPLPAHATRRRRRLDVWVEEGVGQLDCFFRDSHSDGDGVERVVHEYGVRATVDLATHRLVSCDATAGPLPYPECPEAAASAGRLVDAPVVGLRRLVLATLVGPTSCTHLNDALRSLEDAGALLESLTVRRRR